MEPITVKYKVLDTRAKVPSYATPGSAAADLCAVLDAPLTLAPMERALVPTGLAIELPGPHSVALVYARSGLSIKHGLCMANGVGVVDSDYRGELKVPMVNLGREAYTIQPGERVAQLCIAPVYTAAFVPAEELGDTQRGEGGFGYDPLFFSDDLQMTLAEAAPDEYGQLAEEMERRADKAARRKAAGPKRKPGREHHE